MRRRTLLAIILVAGIVVSGPYAVWWTLSVVNGVEKPVLFIASRSMEPALMEGDLILVRRMSPDQVSVGQIIAFRNPSRFEDIIVHRVVEVKGEEGQRLFVTQGDANGQPDPWIVSPDNLLGVYAGTAPLLGQVLQYMGSGIGLSLILAVIIGILILELLSARAKTKSISSSSSGPLEDVAPPVHGFMEKMGGSYETFLALLNDQNCAVDC